jgi:hypothetical protein
MVWHGALSKTQGLDTEHVLNLSIYVCLRTESVYLYICLTIYQSFCISVYGDGGFHWGNKRRITLCNGNTWPSLKFDIRQDSDVKDIQHTHFWHTWRLRCRGYTTHTHTLGIQIDRWFRAILVRDLDDTVIMGWHCNHNPFMCAHEAEARDTVMDQHRHVARGAFSYSTT